MTNIPVPDYISDESDLHEWLLIHDISRLAKAMFDRKVRNLKLTRSQWQVLGTLRRFPGINQAQLAERLEVKPITAGRTLDRLEKAGWIERRASKTDRRINELYLTDRVQHVVTQMRMMSIETRQEMLTGVTQAEHTELVTLLQKIKQNIITKNKAVL